MSYKIGDVVKVVSEDHIRSHFTPEGVDCFRTPGELYVNEIMLQFCGKETVINDVSEWNGEARYSVVDNGWYWDDYCLEDVKQFDFSGLEDLL